MVVRKAHRAHDAYEIWRDAYLTLGAVAWILGCVFVRFLEDNQLVNPPSDARQVAKLTDQIDSS
jgi:hypothetical protein